MTNSAHLYGDEMPSFHATPTRNPYWDPVIAAPKLSIGAKVKTITTSSAPVISSSSPSSSSHCWDWLLFSPEYYSELHTPLLSHTYSQQQKLQEKDDNDDSNINVLASLPACLLALFCLTPKLVHTSDDENDNDQEISSLHIKNESLLSSLSNNNEKLSNISSNSLLSSDNKNRRNFNIHKQNSKEDRSSTPDTDDGYQSASDLSRSDYSQQSSKHDERQNSKDDINIIKHSLPAPLMPRRITYAAAAKPNTSSTNKTSSQMMFSKPKQIFNNTQSTVTNDMLNSKGQKSKFIAPRFERMHHAKQHTSSAISSNRTSVRSNNNNNNNTQRNHTVNSSRRR